MWGVCEVELSGGASRGGRGLVGVVVGQLPSDTRTLEPLCCCACLACLTELLPAVCLL